LDESTGTLKVVDTSTESAVDKIVEVALNEEAPFADVTGIKSQAEKKQVRDRATQKRQRVKRRLIGEALEL